MVHDKDNLHIELGLFLTTENTKRVLKMMTENSNLDESKARDIVWEYYELTEEAPDFLYDGNNEPVVQYTDYAYRLTPNKQSFWDFATPLPEFPLMRDTDGNVYYRLRTFRDVN